MTDDNNTGDDTGDVPTGAPTGAPTDAPTDAGGPHLTLDALADLLAAEGSAADVDHVAGCAGCASRLDELATADAEVASLLAALPPPPMPDGLADRLQAAFDAEPALTPAFSDARPVALGSEESAVALGSGEGPIALGAGAAAAAGTVTPFPAGGRRRRAWVPASAAAALIVAAGALGGTALLTDSPSNDSATSLTAEGGSGDPLAGLAVSETGRDYTGTDTLASSLPALLDGNAPPAGEDTASRPLAGERNDSAPAPAAGEQPAQTFETRSGLASGSAASDDPLGRLRQPEGLASCLTALLPPDDASMRPLALDYAAYSGQPALVVVLPAQDDPRKVDIFIVGAGCSRENDSTLFFARLDRP